MTNPTIAKISCPACDDEDADLRESGKNKRAYVMCGHCGYQGFARGEKANAALRKKARPAAQGGHAGSGAGKNDAGKNDADETKRSKKVSFWHDDIFKIGPKAANE